MPTAHLFTQRNSRGKEKAWGKEQIVEEKKDWDSGWHP